jgi:hypothetical protein
MAHFAEISEDNTVLRVIVVSNNECKDSAGDESEAVGAEFCRNLLGGTWKQTSYNSNIRKQYAGVGYSYNELADVFITPSPFPSWVLNETTTNWDAPVAKPVDDKLYIWDEDTISWLESEITI